jgi:hypothetical protein
MVRGSLAQNPFGILSNVHHRNASERMQARAKSRQPVRSNFQGFRTARHRRGIASLGIAANQRNTYFSKYSMLML